MLKRFDGSITQSPDVDNRIAELGPKHDQTLVEITLANGCVCSFVSDGCVFFAQNVVALHFTRDEIGEVKYKAITKRTGIVTCPDCQIDIPADGHCWYCENNLEAVQNG